MHRSAMCSCASHLQPEPEESLGPVEDALKPAYPKDYQQLQTRGIKVTLNEDHETAYSQPP